MRCCLFFHRNPNPPSTSKGAPDAQVMSPSDTEIQKVSREAFTAIAETEVRSPNPSFFQTAVVITHDDMPESREFVLKGKDESEPVEPPVYVDSDDEMDRVKDTGIMGIRVKFKTHHSTVDEDFPGKIALPPSLRSASEPHQVLVPGNMNVAIRRKERSMSESGSAKSPSTSVFGSSRPPLFLSLERPIKTETV